MAAEMSTGLLAMMNTYKSIPPVSMLVTKVEGEFFKKAQGLTSFFCDEGFLVSEVIQNCITDKQPATVKLKSTGTNGNGEVVAIFYFTWSFKAKY